MTDNDLRLYLLNRGDFEPAAVEALVAFFGGSRISRSFRRLDDLIDELPPASGGAVTLEKMKEVLEVA